jgi:hypothetical protein
MRRKRIAIRAHSFGNAFRRPMRWLMIVLIVSVGALLVLSGGLALHIWRQHKRPAELTEASVREESDVESEEAP